MADPIESDAQPQSKAPHNSNDLREDEFIKDLLKRQDSVLEQLDELNLRIENAILEIGKARQEAIELPNQLETDEAPVSKAA